MSFRELVESLSPDEIEKITGRKPKSGVQTKSIKPENRANGQPTVPTQDSDDSKGYGKRRYMGDDVENEGANLEEGLVKTISRISKGWDKTKSPAEIVKRQASMTDDDVKSFHASTTNAVDGSPQALQHKALSREMKRRGLEEGDVNYAKMHTQANPKYASGTKWRKSSAAVKAKPDDVGAGELGAHNSGSGHVAVKATMNQRDKLADRQEINALGHKTFAIKQTRLPRTSVRKPLPEGIADMPGEFRKLVEAQLNEISRNLATSYISGANLVESALAEENEYSFLRKHGFKKSGTLTDGGVVHTHPEHGAVIINKHGEWHHVPHGSSREDGFEGTTGNTLKNHISRLNESELDEGDVNYAKMHTQANPKYASGTKWRKSSAAVKAKPDDVGAGELGAHNSGSGHVAVKATMNQRDKLADRQEINALGHKAFAIKQTRLPRTSVRKPLPEGLGEMTGGFRELVEAQLNEISRGLATSYISGAKSDERKDRSSGIKLAQKKKWGDAKFGFEEPKVKATSEEVVSESTLGHYHSLAEDAIDNATGFSPKHDEYHKWMTVHHKAMRAHYEQQGNHRMAESHDAVAEHHAGHVADDDFHNGESHHWSGF